MTAPASHDRAVHGLPQGARRARSAAARESPGARPPLAMLGRSPSPKPVSAADADPASAPWSGAWPSPPTAAGWRSASRASTAGPRRCGSGTWRTRQDVIWCRPMPTGMPVRRLLAGRPASRRGDVRRDLADLRDRGRGRHSPSGSDNLGSPVNAVCFLRRREAVATGAWDGNIRFSNVETAPRRSTAEVSPAGSSPSRSARTARRWRRRATRGVIHVPPDLAAAGREP